MSAFYAVYSEGDGAGWIIVADGDSYESVHIAAVEALAGAWAGTPADQLPLQAQLALVRVQRLMVLPRARLFALVGRGPVERYEAVGTEFGAGGSAGGGSGAGSAGGHSFGSTGDQQSQ